MMLNLKKSIAEQCISHTSSVILSTAGLAASRTCSSNFVSSEGTAFDRYLAISACAMMIIYLYLVALKSNACTVAMLTVDVSNLLLTPLPLFHQHVEYRRN